MKRKSLSIAIALLAFTSLFVGCDTPNTESNTNYNEDIQIVAPEEITTEHFIVEDDKTYYTSPGFSLWMEVNGAFLKMDYFSLDGNKRVYDNLYFYEEDYFYIVTDDYKDLYASLGDASDKEYAEEEKEQGYDIQINVKKAGIYKLIFDVDTLKFDMEYKSEIVTPKYYTINNCSIFSVATNWVEMSVNPANADEFAIQNFNIDAGKMISFFNRVHTSNYKVALDENCDGKYASARKTNVTVNVGGTYNVYINAKTYVVRMELVNPDTAKYSCVYYDGEEFKTLTPYELDVPYIFRQRITVDTKYTTSVPDFHTENYRTYTLTIVDPENVLTSSGENFKDVGNYELIVNLKTFELTVRVLPE